MRNVVTLKTNNYLCNFLNNHELLSNSDKNESNHKSSVKSGAVTEISEWTIEKRVNVC